MGEDNEKVRQLFRQLADETSLHGFKYLHNSKGARKLTWFIAVMLATGLVVVLFSSTVKDYFQYKTYIETRLDEELEDLPFPTVTFCFSDNLVDFKFKSFPENITLEEYKFIFSAIHNDKEVDDEVIALFDRLNISTYETLIKSYHLTLEDTVLHEVSMIFNHRKPCSFSKQNCTMDDLKLVWTMDGRHACLQFNTYNPQKQQKHQDVIFSPFRVYLDLRARMNRGLVRRGLLRYRKCMIRIHDYGQPHHIVHGRGRNTKLIDSASINPGYKYVLQLDRKEVR